MIYLLLYRFGVTLGNLLIAKTTLSKDNSQLGNICFQTFKTHLYLTG